MTDLLHIVQTGTVRAGDHLICIELTDEGRLDYCIQDFHGRRWDNGRDDTFDDFESALTHALASLVHLLEKQYPGEDDDSVEGPGMDKAIARNLLERICENQAQSPKAILHDTATQPVHPVTTLGALHEQLATLLTAGKDPMAPVRLRVYPREPNIHASAPAINLAEAWFNDDDKTLYLDEEGI